MALAIYWQCPHPKQPDSPTPSALVGPGDLPSIPWHSKAICSPSPCPLLILILPTPKSHFSQIPNSYSRLRNISTELIHRGTCTPLFIAVLSTITKLRKEPKRPSTDEWIKKMWFIYTVEYYLAMSKNEILPFAAMWMELGGIMLSEISQSEKDSYHVFTHMWNLRNLIKDQGKGKK